MAYREVSQAYTDFSSFNKLLYGRQVRGPLDILRETWESSNKSSESIVSHVINMHEKMDRMTELVQENLAKTQKEQKQCKLLAQWQGPYQIEKKVGMINYVVDMADRRNTNVRIFHVNMLNSDIHPSTYIILYRK